MDTTIGNASVPPTVSGSGMRYLAWDCDLDEVQSFAPIVEMWRTRTLGRRGLAGVPAWTDFKVTDFTGWFTYMARSVVAGNRDDVEFRYFGSALAFLFGEDFTRRTFRDMAPAAHRDFLRNHWKTFFDSPVIAVGQIRSMIGNRDNLMIRIIHLPMVTDGATVDGVLHFVQRLELGAQPLSLSPEASE